jgi:tripartite-type tricarboxylate transporter receptor subunit TctC
MISVLGLAAGNDVGLAAEQSPFYQGKVVRVVVGTAPGGGFDVYARTIARHWGKYIPGNPQIIIENQPGAATLVAAKHVFQARPDGLTIGNFIADIALGRLLNQPGVDFDFQRFECIGVPVRDNRLCSDQGKRSLDYRSMESVQNSSKTRRHRKIGHYR